MTYLRLLLAFIKIGFSSFSGVTMIPMIQEEVLRYGWMTNEEILDLVAIAEATPGPLGLNAATFAGMRAAGTFGALIAAFGVLMPSFTIALLVAVFFYRFRNSTFTEDILIGIRPGTVGITLGVLIGLAKTTYWNTDQGFRPVTLVISAICLFLLTRKKMSPQIVVVFAAAMGLILAAVRSKVG